ncbi:unnamed protein product, partial [marine sediment metagenome]
PTNVTYIRKNITLNFRVTDHADTSLACYKEVNNTGQVSVGSIANNSEYIEGINFTESNHNINITCTDSDGLNDSKIVYFSNIYYNITDNRTYDTADIYEANSTDYAIEVRVAPFLYISSCPTTYLHLTNETTKTDVKITASSNNLGNYRCNYTASTNMYLINKNNTNVTHRWNISLSEIGRKYTSWLNQTILYNFYPISQVATPSSQIEGEDVEINVTAYEGNSVPNIAINITLNDTDIETTKIGDYYRAVYTIPPLFADTTYEYYSTMNVSYTHPNKVSAADFYFRNLTNSSFNAF